ncbi:hypothetical protein BJ508DRAFT_301160 [Ascobolus immersus RN42]|uniref:Uncharacterized protein n=1 Tax=Ascobolus immersus RN42 TaxID=1160509 RepID=A0A3N4IQL4_ASCIM|nr:hypothetical protein BJ508DRAFT_301160 [Ascobolus immersus RN42]
MGRSSKKNSIIPSNSGSEGPRSSRRHNRERDRNGRGFFLSDRIENDSDRLQKEIQKLSTVAKERYAHLETKTALGTQQPESSFDLPGVSQRVSESESQMATSTGSTYAEGRAVIHHKSNEADDGLIGSINRKECQEAISRFFEFDRTTESPERESEPMEIDIVGQGSAEINDVNLHHNRVSSSAPVSPVLDAFAARQHQQIREDAEFEIETELNDGDGDGEQPQIDPVDELENDIINGKPAGLDFEEEYDPLITSSQDNASSDRPKTPTDPPTVDPDQQMQDAYNEGEHGTMLDQSSLAVPRLEASALPPPPPPPPPLDTPARVEPLGEPRSKTLIATYTWKLKHQIADQAWVELVEIIQSSWFAAAELPRSATTLKAIGKSLPTQEILEKTVPVVIVHGHSKSKGTSTMYRFRLRDIVERSLANPQITDQSHFGLGLKPADKRNSEVYHGRLLKESVIAAPQMYPIRIGQSADEIGETQFVFPGGTYYVRIRDRLLAALSREVIVRVTGVFHREVDIDELGDKPTQSPPIWVSVQPIIARYEDLDIFGIQHPMRNMFEFTDPLSSLKQAYLIMQDYEMPASRLIQPKDVSSELARFSEEYIDEDDTESETSKDGDENDSGSGLDADSLDSEPLKVKGPKRNKHVRIVTDDSANIPPGTTHIIRRIIVPESTSVFDETLFQRTAKKAPKSSSETTVTKRKSTRQSQSQATSIQPTTNTNTYPTNFDRFIAAGHLRETLAELELRAGEFTWEQLSTEALDDNGSVFRERKIVVMRRMSISETGSLPCFGVTYTSVSSSGEAHDRRVPVDVAHSEQKGMGEYSLKFIMENILSGKDSKTGVGKEEFTRCFVRHKFPNSVSKITNPAYHFKAMQMHEVTTLLSSMPFILRMMDTTKNIIRPGMAILYFHLFLLYVAHLCLLHESTALYELFLIGSASSTGVYGKFDETYPRYSADNERIPWTTKMIIDFIIEIPRSKDSIGDARRSCKWKKITIGIVIGELVHKLFKQLVPHTNYVELDRTFCRYWTLMDSIRYILDSETKPQHAWKTILTDLTTETKTLLSGYFFGQIARIGGDGEFAQNSRGLASRMKFMQEERFPDLYFGSPIVASYAKLNNFPISLLDLPLNDRVVNGLRLAYESYGIDETQLACLTKSVRIYMKVPPQQSPKGTISDRKCTNTTCPCPNMNCPNGNNIPHRSRQKQTDGGNHPETEDTATDNGDRLSLAYDRICTHNNKGINYVFFYVEWLKRSRIRRDPLMGGLDLYELVPWERPKENANKSKTKDKGDNVEWTDFVGLPALSDARAPYFVDMTNRIGSTTPTRIPRGTILYHNSWFIKLT